MDEARQKFQELSEDLQKSQEGTRTLQAEEGPRTNSPNSEIRINMEALQRLDTQYQENKSVHKVLVDTPADQAPRVILSQELESLGGDSNVYKLVGPVLLKQGRPEAVLAVEGRLGFIEKEK